MAAHVPSNVLNGNGQLHVTLPTGRKVFLRSLPPRIGTIEDELNELQLRLAAIEARPVSKNTEPTTEARLELVKFIVTELLHTGRRRSHRQVTSAHTGRTGSVQH
jgi:hypothetical protein